MHKEEQKFTVHTSILTLLSGFCLLRQAGVQPCGCLCIVTAEDRNSRQHTWAVKTCSSRDTAAETPEVSVKMSSDWTLLYNLLMCSHHGFLRLFLPMAFHLGEQTMCIWNWHISSKGIKSLAIFEGMHIACSFSCWVFKVKPLKRWSYSRSDQTLLMTWCMIISAHAHPMITFWEFLKICTLIRVMCCQRYKQVHTDTWRTSLSLAYSNVVQSTGKSNGVLMFSKRTSSELNMNETTQTCSFAVFHQHIHYCI